MPREDASLLIRPWAAGGDTRRPEQDSLDRNIGWPASYSQAGGDLPARETFNQLFLEMSTMLHEINLHGGILEWNSGIAYSHPAVVMAGDVPWISVRDSTGTDPETAGQTDWRMLIPASVQAASQSIAGIIALATQDETNAGSVSTRAVTPATLHNRTATTTRRGIVELATSAETAGTDSSRAVTPAGLSARTSSTTRSGIVELATAAETAAGQDNSRAVTPFSMANLIPGPATQTERGIIELATQAEVDLGTDGVRAVTPARLRNTTSLPGGSEVLRKIRTRITSTVGQSLELLHDLTDYDILGFTADEDNETNSTILIERADLSETEFSRNLLGGEHFADVYQVRLVTGNPRQIRVRIVHADATLYLANVFGIEYRG